MREIRSNRTQNNAAGPTEWGEASSGKLQATALGIQQQLTTFDSLPLSLRVCVTASTESFPDLCVLGMQFISILSFGRLLVYLLKIRWQ